MSVLDKPPLSDCGRPLRTAPNKEEREVQICSKLRSILALSPWQEKSKPKILNLKRR